MATIFGVSYTWGLSGGMVLGVTAVIAIAVIRLQHSGVNKNKKKKLFAAVLSLLYFYSILTSGGVFLIQFIANILYFVVAYSILVLTHDDMALLLKFISRITSVMFCISLIGWVLYLVGVPLPHTSEFVHEDDYHTYVNYYLFVTTPYDYLIVPRFMGVFKEPGHAASICVLLILANIKNLKSSKFDIIVFAISLIISFSLGGWIVMAFALLLMSLLEGKHRVLKLVGIALLSGFLIFEFYGNDDSALNQYIFSRLEYDDETGIAGNNRTSDYFDSKYDQFSKSSDVWFGISSKLQEGDDWTKGSAGVKVSIVHWGYIGFFIMQVVFILYFLNNRCRHGLIFLISYMVLCYIRAYFINPYWFYIYLLAIPLLYKQSKSKIIKTVV